MNKSSERIVIFVTPAQKLAISTSAQRLGISVSELIRRAVLEFEATGDQVKAASIVDRLHAPQAPNALNETLRRVAKGAPAVRHAAPAASADRPDDGTPPRASLGASVARAIAKANDETRFTQEAVERVTAKKAAEQTRPPAKAAAPKAVPPKLSPPQARIETDGSGAEVASNSADGDVPGAAEEGGSFA
ncbi:plasmid mobilization protein [Trinickia mobilis]|uniref:plasmid mobilization protein n=1 Tax=Trinickia mobilis TaxID=2816356 RepID=UPI001F5C7CF4|nr:hypothetical protein [Trinickia mobilis]